jgi:hypothetical protein
MTTLLEIYNALSTGEDIDIEVIDEVKFKTDVVDETTEEIEGTATVVVAVNSQVTQDIRKRGKKSYQIYSMKIEKIVLHGVSMTFSELKEKYGELCLGDVDQDVRDGGRGYE